MSSLLVRQLKEEIAAPERMLAVLGTGVSVGASGNSDVASWTGLLHNGVDRCLALGKCDDVVATRLRGQIGGDMVDLLCAAENISQRLGAPGPDYEKWLTDTVGTLRVRDGAVIKALMELGVPIATTNYDGLIEEVTGLRPVTWQKRSRTESWINGKSHGVLHLHGHWEDPSSVILGIRSYDAILSDEHAQGLLQALRFTRIFLFVGFGSGLDDLNFGAFLHWTGRVFRNSPTSHFRLCLGSEVENTRKQHPPNHRIEAVSYGDAHTDLPGFLRSLRGNHV